MKGLDEKISSVNVVVKMTISIESLFDSMFSITKGQCMPSKESVTEEMTNEVLETSGKHA